MRAHLNAEVYSGSAVNASQVLPVFFIQILADADVLKHALEFGGIFKPARLLQKTNYIRVSYLSYSKRDLTNGNR